MQVLSEVGGQCVRRRVIRHTSQCDKTWLRVQYQKWMRRASFVSGSKRKQCHYDILGVSREATQADIKTAFLNKTKEMHPDVKPGDPSMHARFVRLNEAYSVLSKDVTRREYDYSLAAQLAYRRNLHHDNSHMPGAGTYTNPESEKPFWDETIFEMRDKSDDPSRFYTEDAYYGVKGVRRLANSTIVMGCFIVMGLGVLLHLGALQYSKLVLQSNMDDKDRRTMAHLRAVQHRARYHGNSKQLELLRARVVEEEGKRGGDGGSSHN